MLGNQIEPWEVLEKRGQTDKQTNIKNLLYGYLLPAIIGPPINLGSRGTSNVVQGARFKVGVRRAASSASRESGLKGTKSEKLLPVF